MAFVVTRSQQVVTAGVYPISMYSRIETLAVTALGDGVWRYRLTPKLGKNLWLLSVNVWTQPGPIVYFQGTEFRVFAGSGNPGSVAGLETWEEVVPVLAEDGSRGQWMLGDGKEHFAWTMSRYYKGAATRFALAYYRGPAQGFKGLYASFLVSEG